MREQDEAEAAFPGEPESEIPDVLPSFEASSLLGFFCFDSFLFFLFFSPLKIRSEDGIFFVNFLFSPLLISPVDQGGVV